ncbi:MAG: 2-C-methyl-D-erythritol 4-phosphate cytidylyltransferase [Acidobacteria bacterium]|nr:2-C-methyl-D-erythritol 4-phosphate cytidylyltransferase [Acidobacteriota bacterium]
MNTAIIVAAGSGKRFGSDIPKQFSDLHGKPLIVHTIESFERCESINEIVLVLSPDEINNFTERLGQFSFTKLARIVAGGKTRAESVLNGLNTVDSENAGIIAVHDGARPLVTALEISETLQAARQTGAACLVAKVTDTIKRIEGGRIICTLDRDNLVKALTPQCFRYELLMRAFADNNIDEKVTDECCLVEKLGVEIQAVIGSSRNIKITHREDLKIAEALFNDAELICE